MLDRFHPGRGHNGRAPLSPFLSAAPPDFLDIPPVWLQTSRRRRWERHPAQVVITPALTFTQMGRRSSFVFIFCRLASAASRHSPPRHFVIFQGRPRSPARFTLMKQLPAAPELRLRWKMKRADPERRTCRRSSRSGQSGRERSGPCCFHNSYRGNREGGLASGKERKSR